jgi:hypothetical protein
MNDIIKIPNINNYKQEIINNTLILTPIYIIVNETELISKELNNSKINYSIIKDNNDDIISNDKNKWFPILKDIYISMAASIILQNTTFNIKLTNENGNKRYDWCPEIKMSIQKKDANGTLKEIIKMIKINNYKIDIGIKLSSNEMIKYFIS